jgi:hypothetical protein
LQTNFENFVTRSSQNAPIVVRKDRVHEQRHHHHGFGLRGPPARVGYVLHHLDERVFEALDPDNRSHGTYATHREAAAALPPVSSTEEITTAIKRGSRHG